MFFQIRDYAIMKLMQQCNSKSTATGKPKVRSNFKIISRLMNYNFKSAIILLFVSFLLTLNAFKCGSDSFDSMKEKFTQKWIHSHEEDEGENIAYRNESYSFPPSRGRTSMEFKADGSFIQTDISPVDTLVSAQGTWSHKDGKKIEIKLKMKPAREFIIEIVEFADDKMKIKFIQ